MKTRSVLVIEVVTIFSLVIVPTRGEEIPVPNGSFEQIYQPGSTTITADLGANWTNGIGADTPMHSGQTATYSDGSSGASVDIPGWISVPGWPFSHNWPSGSGSITRQRGHAPDGDYYYTANGGSWGNSQGGAIQLDAPLTTVTTVGGDLSYTVSMLVNGPVAPVLLELLADDIPLTPSSMVNPAPPLAWDVVSRTYDAASLDGQLGKGLKIRVGWGPEASGTQSHLDMVTLTYIPGNSPSFPLTIARATAPDSGYDLEWPSATGMLYNVRSSPDLTGDIASWDLVEGDLAATPDKNAYNVTPTEKALFYAVESYPVPPVTVFAENFDEGVIPPALPAGWSTGANGADTGTTLWQLGAPTVVGPAAAHSGANCVGTNLDAKYGASSDRWLRTPAIDLSGATDATLVFQHWVDMDDFDLGDSGTVRILDASVLPTVTVLETLQADIQGIEPTNWVEFSKDLTEASLGKSVVVEFLFVSDNFADEDVSGWYIDDVMVTTPGS